MVSSADKLFGILCVGCGCSGLTASLYSIFWFFSRGVGAPPVGHGGVRDVGGIEAWIQSLSRQYIKLMSVTSLT